MADKRDVGSVQALRGGERKDTLLYTICKTDDLTALVAELLMLCSPTESNTFCIKGCSSNMQARERCVGKVQTR